MKNVVRYVETKNLLFFLLGGAALFVLFLLASNLSNPYFSLAFIFVPFIIFAFTNINTAYQFLIITLFIDFYIYRFSIGVLFSAVVFASFLITYQKLKVDDFKTPINKYLLIYLISILPSFINNASIKGSLLLFYNFIVFILLLFSGYIVFQSKVRIERIIKLFLILTAVNSIWVLAESLFFEKRAFGITGIMYVDYVGIAIVMVVIVLALQRQKKYKYLFLFVLFALGSFATQTRNAWFSIVITLSLLFIYFYKNSEKYNLRKKSLIRIAAGLVVFIPILFFTVSQFNESLAQRTGQLNELEYTFDYEGNVQNSLISRFLIWHTAYMAFSAHPITGVGVYAFPFASPTYSRIPDFLYELYVRGLTPHQTFIAIAAETGIIGLTGFLILLFYSLKISFSNLKHYSANKFDQLIFLSTWALVYIAVSMLFTDAWLWGQGIVLWAVFLSINLAAYSKKMNTAEV